MTEEPERPEPPVDLPTDLRNALEAHASDPHELRETIVYAQELLNALPEPGTTIEPREGEEIVRIEEHPGYTEVVKQFEGRDEAYLYHVIPEPQPDGDEHLHWSLIGRMSSMDSS